MRDALDLGLAMRAVLWALAPCALVGLGNSGYQTLHAAELQVSPGPLAAWLEALGLTASSRSAAACLAVGLARAAPILLVAAGVGRAWTWLFARVRGRSSAEALPVVVLLFSLSLPPLVPLWQVALGISFAVVVGLEIFGGTGRNVVNPALVGVAFLYFCYPASFSAEGAWVGLDGAPATTVLRAWAEGGEAAVRAGGIQWADTVWGREPGALGETSAVACLAGGAFLVYAQLASWRVIAGGVLGLLAAASLANASAGTGPGALPWYWHLTTGSFAFGLVFLATDPVTSPTTGAGRWLYGAFIGTLVVLIRVFNPAHPEGVLMAILLGNVLSPVLDRAVAQVHGIRRRRRRV